MLRIIDPRVDFEPHVHDVTDEEFREVKRELADDPVIEFKPGEDETLLVHIELFLGLDDVPKEHVEPRALTEHGVVVAYPDPAWLVYRTSDKRITRSLVERAMLGLARYLMDNDMIDGYLSPVVSADGSRQLLLRGRHFRLVPAPNEPDAASAWEPKPTEEEDS